MPVEHIRFQAIVNLIPGFLWNGQLGLRVLWLALFTLHDTTLVFWA